MRAVLRRARIEIRPEKEMSLMSSPMFKGIGGRFALVIAAAALLVGFSASTALASVILNPAAPGPYTAAGQVVKVRGTAPAEATEVAIAVCNVETGVAVGGRCDGAKAVPGLKPVSEYQSNPPKLSIE